MTARKSRAWPGPSLNIPPGFRLPMAAWAIGFLTALNGILFLVLSPFIGSIHSDPLWGVELTYYFGGIATIAGLLISVSGLGFAMLRARWDNDSLLAKEQQIKQWQKSPQQFFKQFDEALERPISNIASKEQKLRATIQTSGGAEESAVEELLDEIARQTRNLHLIFSNIQALALLESPEVELPVGPVDLAEVVRRIAERYSPVAVEAGKELNWRAELQDFRIVSPDPQTVEHIITNLVDNAVTHASGQVEISLTTNRNGFHIQVRDDGPGIAPHHLEHIFHRGWTAEAGRGEKKASPGLGLFIARTLARRCGGELTVESTAAPQTGHQTEFRLALPLKEK